MDEAGSDIWWNLGMMRKTYVFSLLLFLSNDFPKLQIRSSPFRLKMNESWNFPPNFSSIGPRMKWDQTFDEIWARWKKTCIFLFSSFSPRTVALPLLSPFFLVFQKLGFSMESENLGFSVKKMAKACWSMKYVFPSLPFSFYRTL